MKILIADDERLACERLRALLAEVGFGAPVGEASNGHEVVEACIALRPDVVLMDIAMPGMDGIEAARRLAALESPPAVVFCTAYDEHALSAFETAAVDYLLKPVRAERLAEALARVRARRDPLPRAPEAEAPRRKHLCARLRGSLRLIAIEDIRYLQAEEKYVVVHHARGEDLVEESLKALEQEFADGFVRIHRNCLVARDRVAELRRGGGGRAQVVLRDGAALEVSRRCLPSVREEFRQL